MIELKKDLDARSKDFQSLTVLMQFGKHPENASIEDIKAICDIFGLQFDKAKEDFAKYHAALLLSSDPSKKILRTCETLSLCYAKVLSLFADSYECERIFSKMNLVLNEYRSNLTQLHLEKCLMAACSRIGLDFDRIVCEMDCQVSH